MRIVDARSGKDVKVGRWVFYPAPSPVALTFDGPPNAPDAVFDLVPTIRADGTKVLRPVPKDPTRWRHIQNTEKVIRVPGRGPISKDSFRVLDFQVHGDHADVLVEFIEGRRVWVKAPIQGVFWRRVMLPT